MTAKPWNLLGTETVKAYQAFEVYRDMGTGRSLERVHHEATTRPPLDTLKRWSATHDWQARVRAFDEAAAAKASERALEDAAAVRARQAQHAKAIQLRAMQKIAAMDPGDMSMAEATRAWQVGAEAERKALGIADRLEHSGPEGGPIQTQDVVDEDARTARLLALMAVAKAALDADD
jgi:hypothetical protein